MQFFNYFSKPIILKAECFAGTFFFCANNNPWACPHSIHFGYSYFCLCPLLNLVATEMFVERNTTGLNIPAVKVMGIADYPKKFFIN
jgi:hypothetical protein